MNMCVLSDYVCMLCRFHGIVFAMYSYLHECQFYVGKWQVGDVVLLVLFYCSFSLPFEG
jgi:hypothetical protein